LEIIDKLQGQLTEKQYISVRVLLLEEKFKELIPTTGFIYYIDQ